MALVWQCDRCKGITSQGGNVDDPPDNWSARDMPVRGSSGARSSMPVVLCVGCDDELYEWFHNPPASDEHANGHAKQSDEATLREDRA